MTGERVAWFEVASHLRTPVEELKARMTFSEFLDWLVYLQRESKWKVKQEFYLAQIAAEIRRSLVLHPEKVHVKDFILRDPEELAAEQREKKERSKHSKSIWMAHLQLNN